MEIKDCINVTLKKNEVIIKIDVTADHKKVMANLKKKIPELKKLYKEDKTPILIKGKILSTKEKKEIKTLIQDAIDVEVRFEGAKALGLYGIQETYCREISTSETKFHRGSLRSGQRLEFEGSIVILGYAYDNKWYLVELVAEKEKDISFWKEKIKELDEKYGLKNIELMTKLLMNG